MKKKFEMPEIKIGLFETEYIMNDSDEITNNPWENETPEW